MFINQQQQKKIIQKKRSSFIAFIMPLQKREFLVKSEGEWLDWKGE